ncbi:hypothetical protein G2W53_005239 [Senna tora]|uniref:Uncharacterized protein n=1 Tax=Senna tora TaxID=362788 RepID=A0A835CIX5_9FABA|nr:hypothetical protein G2W53_005239 [Senna tora]
MNFPVRRHTAGIMQYASRGMEVNGQISTEPRAHLRTWCNRSDRFIGADPLKAGLLGMQYTDFHPLQCILKPVKISSVTEP